MYNYSKESKKAIKLFSKRKKKTKERNQPHAFGTRAGRKTCLAHSNMATDPILTDVNIQTRYPIVRLPSNISQLILCLPVRIKIARHHNPRRDDSMFLRQVPLCEGGLYAERSGYHAIPSNGEYTIEPELEESSVIFFPTSFSSHCFLESLDMLDPDSEDAC